MAQRLQLYRCEVCGHIIMVFGKGAGTLTCCDQAMTLCEENTTDAAKEKHVPVIEKTDEGHKVRVGSVPHPMEDAHHIQWIEVVGGDILCCRFLKPGQAPEAEFKGEAGPVYAREYCNLHGYWKGE
ncbi:MAG TPA: desulfoferrodoxin [Candidatus Hydrogenedentes bacterium]|nr:desulfoferrodoxin [Candidatus Hydrogenedentota bacterium]